MEVKILYGGALFLAGWLWFFLFFRQFLFNIITAYPLIGRMKKIDKELIAIGATRYTTVSLIVSGFMSVVLGFVVFFFCKRYMIINFCIGALVCLLMYINKLSPKNRPMFDTFCSAYYRFVPDDELRTAMYNKKPSQMKVRLHDMGFKDDFIPEFKK